MLRRPFCGMAAGFLLGILAAAYPGNRLLIAVVAGSVGYMGYLWLRRSGVGQNRTEESCEKSGRVWTRRKKGKGQLILRISLCILMFFLGRSQYSREQDFRGAYLPYLEENMHLSVQGRLSGKQIRNDQYIYELRSCVIGLDQKETSENVPAFCNRILVYSDSDEASIGEILCIDGTVILWKSAVNEGNFDEKSFYEARKLDFGLKDIHIRGTYGEKSRWREGLWQLRLRLKEVYRNVMEPEAAGILTTMALGDKELLGSETKRLYQVGGLSHIMAISGLHISIIGMTLYRFLRKRGMGFIGAGLLAGGVMYAYGTMAGMGISVQRALVMFVLSLVAQVLGRGYDTLNALGVAALGLLWDNPYLLWDAGFQFSFAAILGVAWVGKCVTFAGKGKGTASRRREKVEKVFVSGAIQLTTLPLVAWYYYELPVYAIALNLLILPMMGVLLSLGIAGGLAGLVSMRMAGILLFPCEKLLAVSSFLCSLSSELPGAMWITGRPKLWRIVIYYGVLAGATLLAYRRKGNQAAETDSKAWKSAGTGETDRVAEKLAGTGETKERKRSGELGFRLHGGRILAVSTLLIVLLCVPGRGGFELDILDVGQGDASFLRTEQGYTIFVDGGSSNVSKVGIYRILPFLKYKGVRGIDYWMVSHTDEDHISGLMELLEAGYEIRNLVFSKEVVQDETLWELLALAEQEGTEILYLNAGDVLHLGRAKLTVLFPPSGGEIAGDAAGMDEAGADRTARKKTTVDRNAASLVVWYEEGDFSGIFTGDIGSAEEKKLLEILEEMCLLGKIDGMEVDFYKAAHHGSKYSNSEEFLMALKPRIATVSCAKKNTYGHPGAEAVRHMEEAGSQVFYTMEAGQIKLTQKKGMLLVSMPCGNS